MIYIYHAYRNNFEKNINIFKRNENIIINVSKDLTLLSIMNEECFNNSYLVKQCKNNGIDLIVPKSTFNIKKEEWKNTIKISTIVKALKEINTKYVLILDGKDTCILNSLDDEFLNKFKEMNCDILFNMQKLQVPNITFKDYKHPINAGVCIGTKEALLNFYKECEELNKIDKYIFNNGLPSEQYIVRKTAHNSALKIETDYEMKLFTCYSEYIVKEVDSK